MEPRPKELEGVGVTERAGTKLPLGLEFTDEAGRAVRLGDYVRGKRPFILNLVYYRCAMLCNLILNGQVEALKGIPWTPGREFEIITVSIDPRETHTLAKLKKQNYIRDYGKPEAAGGWHFLTGGEKSIRALADAAGFGYRYDEKKDIYVHSAAIFLGTPDGRLSRYLYGVMFAPATLKLSLVEASEGKTGGAIDKIMLFCFHYDADSGRYGPAAMNIMRLGGALTALLLGGALGIFWMREAGGKQRREKAA